VDNAETIEAQAARWLARREGRPHTPEVDREFEAWCAADSRHLGAYVRLEAVSARLDRAGALSGLSVRKPARLAPRVWIPVAAAAALALAAWPTMQLMRAPVETRSFATEVGEQRRAPLADGSLVEFNTATRASVTLRRHEREVRLVAGEALFEVAKDKHRPFIVKTTLGDVRAVGTVFSVRLDGDLEVAVSEGVVEVEREGRVVARVSAGETFAMRSGGEAVRKGGQSEKIAREMAWREGKVAFSGETLAEAAAELNRYNRVKIQINDPDVAQMRFGGLFRATDPEGFTAALEKALPVDARQEGQVIVLTARDT
jgi:transmembrane sensor